MPLCIIASWKSITTRVPRIHDGVPASETLLVGTFSALDLVLFYLFFEGGLIPMFLIIGIWAGPRRSTVVQVSSSTRCSLGLCARHHGAVLERRHHRHPTLMHTACRARCRPGLAGVLCLVCSEDADVAGAHLAAGRPRRGAHRGLGGPGREILLKLGGYGFLRFSLPMFPLASHDFAWIIFRCR